MQDIMCQEYIVANSALVAARPMTWAQRRQSRMDTSVQGKIIRFKSPSIAQMIDQEKGYTHFVKVANLKGIYGLVV